jgi:Tol biopolymer transport system component
MWRSGRSMAAYRVSKVKRALVQRPRLLMTVGAVLLVVVLVVLQPVFWRGRWPAASNGTPQPVAETIAPTATGSALRTRSVSPKSTPAAPTPQLPPILPGYDLVCMSRTGEDEPWQIIALNPRSGETVAITQTSSNERTPRWSPDGRRLAFASDRDGEREVYVMDLSQPQAAPVNISQHPAPDWQPAWSPDGRRVAFASYRDDNWEIYVADADGSNLTRLTEHAENDFAPSWSPDGHRLVFVSRRYADADLFVIDVETRALTQLTTGQWNEFEPAWSPDGAWIAFVTQIEDQGDIFVMRADGSEAVNVTQSPYANDFQPAWTPDSEWLIYVTYTTAKGDHDLWAMRRDGSDARPLIEDARDDLAPNWRPSTTISPAGP